MPRKRKYGSRVFWKGIAAPGGKGYARDCFEGGRAYGDFRNIGGKIEALKEPGSTVATSDAENHPIEITSLCKEAQNRLVEIRLDDVDDVISLRVTGRERVIGVRFGAALRLLWWDPSHEVCPSTKKHT